MFREFTWEIYDGRPIVLYGSFAKAVGILLACSGRKTGKLLYCNPLDIRGRSYPELVDEMQQAAEQDRDAVSKEIYEKEQQMFAGLGRLSVETIALEEIPRFENCYPIITGKVGIKAFLKALGCEDVRKLYSAVPILTDGYCKVDYFSYFCSYLRKQRDLVCISGLEVVLTTGCSLRCRDCANLIQYYRPGGKIEKEVVISSLQKLLDAVDGVAILKLLGGEPLLAQDTLREILYLLRKPENRKVMGVQITTNGTLLFEEETLAALEQNPLAAVFISDYGILSRKKTELERQLKLHQIPFAEAGVNDPWVDYGRPDERFCRLEECEERFWSCGSRVSCTTLLDGAWYNCPRSAHGYRLGYYQSQEARVDLLAQDGGICSLREQIHSLYQRRTPIEACCYCRNGDKEMQYIRRAIQCSK